MIPNPEQDVRAFIIGCYKKLYRQGKLSGQGIARHNQLVDEYTRKFHSSNMQKIKMTKRIKDNIRIIKKLPKIKGVKEINFPGEGTKKRYKKNMKKNIPIPKSIMEDLKKLNAI